MLLWRTEKRQLALPICMEADTLASRKVLVTYREQRRHWEHQVWNFTSSPGYSVSRVSSYSCWTSRFKKEKSLLFLETFPSQDWDLFCWGTSAEKGKFGMLSSYLSEALLGVSEQSHGSRLDFGKLNKNHTRQQLDRSQPPNRIIGGISSHLPTLRIRNIGKRTVSKSDLPFF